MNRMIKVNEKLNNKITELQVNFEADSLLSNRKNEKLEQIKWMEKNGAG